MPRDAKCTESAERACTVSVVSHGQGKLVETLLADLGRASPYSIAEIIVTRNLPDERINLPPGGQVPVRFVDNPVPRGFAANHNAAFALCATPWFAVLNPDLRIAGDPFEPMLAEAEPGTALLCPRVLEPDGREADSARALPTPARLIRRTLARAMASTPACRSTRKEGEASARAPRPPEWFAGMFMLLRADAMRTVGGFDERYFMYCEDVDLCARLRLAGWELRQVPAATVRHEARRASRRSLRHLRWHLASLARLWTSAAFWRYRSLIAAEHRVRSTHRMARN